MHIGSTVRSPSHYNTEQHSEYTIVLYNRKYECTVQFFLLLLYQYDTQNLSLMFVSSATTSTTTSRYYLVVLDSILPLKIIFLPGTTLTLIYLSPFHSISPHAPFSPSPSLLLSLQDLAKLSKTQHQLRTTPRTQGLG